MRSEKIEIDQGRRFPHSQNEAKISAASTKQRAKSRPMSPPDALSAALLWHSTVKWTTLVRRARRADRERTRRLALPRFRRL